MPPRSKARSGALTEIWVEVDGKVPVRLGLVENFDYNEGHSTTLHTGVGDQHPQENQHHGTTGVTLSWGYVHTNVKSESLEEMGALPTIRTLATLKPCTIRVKDIDPDSPNDPGKPVAEFYNCLPSSFSNRVGAQMALQSNVSFGATHMKRLSDF